MTYIIGANVVKEVLNRWITTGVDQSNSSVSGNVPVGGIIMWSGAVVTIPSSWALCDGGNGTPDLRDKFIVGAKQDSGGVAKSNITGSLLQNGGGVAHHHADHVFTQSANHVIGQPADHAAVTHSGATIDAHAGVAITDHASLAHSGAGVDAHAGSAISDHDSLTHSVTQPNAHSDHDSQGGHTHDAHAATLGVAIGGALGFFVSPTTHNNQGGHTHNAHTAHAGTAVTAHSTIAHAVTQPNAHTVTQAGNHAALAHTITQANNHSVGQASSHAALIHSGVTVDVHSGAGVDTHDTLQAVQPFFALAFIMRVS